MKTVPHLKKQNQHITNKRKTIPNIKGHGSINWQKLNFIKIKPKNEYCMPSLAKGDQIEWNMRHAFNPNSDLLFLSTTSGCHCYLCKLLFNCSINQMSTTQFQRSPNKVGVYLMSACHNTTEVFGLSTNNSLIRDQSLLSN